MIDPLEHTLAESSAPVVDAQALFDREAPEAYLAEWTSRLAAPEQQEDHDLRSVVLLRLGDEWLALETRFLSEVTDTHPVHSVPHRTNAVLLGLVNIRGQLRLCASLHGLLGIEPRMALEDQDDGAAAMLRQPRMVVLQDRNEQWVCVADEVVEVHRVRSSALGKVPSTFGKGSSYSLAVFAWNHHTVGLLDGNLILNQLRSLGQ